MKKLLSTTRTPPTLLLSMSGSGWKSKSFTSRPERQTGAYDIWLPSELRVVSTSDALFDETLFPSRPKGDQRPEDPPSLQSDGNATQPPIPCRLETRNGPNLPTWSQISPWNSRAPRTRALALRLALAPHASRTVS